MKIQTLFTGFIFLVVFSASGQKNDFIFNYEIIVKGINFKNYSPIYGRSISLRSYIRSELRSMCGEYMFY